MFYFELFKRYPLLGFAVCSLLLTFVTAQNVVEGAAIEGYLGKPRMGAGIALEKFTTRGRRGATNCMVKAQVEGSLYNMRLDCGEWRNLEVNGLFKVVGTSRGPASLSIMRGHFYLDFALMLLELAGIFYFLSLICDRVFGAPTILEGLMRSIHLE